MRIKLLFNISISIIIYIQINEIISVFPNTISNYLDRGDHRSCPIYTIADIITGVKRSQYEYPNKDDGDNAIGGVIRTQSQKKNPILEQSCRTKEGLNGYCQPAAYCFSQYNDLDDYDANRCQLNNGPMGICCPREERPVLDEYKLPIRIPPPYDPNVKIRRISRGEINKAARESQSDERKYFRKEKTLITKGFHQKSGTPAAFHQAFFGGFDQTQFNITKGGNIILRATIIIKEKFGFTNEEARDGLLKTSVKLTDLQQYCIARPLCFRKQSKYRTADGSCNNVRNPLWGRSNTQFSRIAPPAYADGLNELRVSVDGSPLPGPRQVSLAAATDKNITDKHFTLFVMQWGQFIDHDLTLASATRAASGEGIMCCEETKLDPRKDPQLMHPECRPIYIPEDDPFYVQFNQTCLNFVRNAPVPHTKCTLGHREQMNTLTSYIDGSQVYGSDKDRADHLRSFKNGLLRISTVNDREFLPFDTQNRSDMCGIQYQSPQLQCFVGGDVRVNEQTGLTMLHNLLLREHNRVARELLERNPQWNDETVYQETRRIIGAEIQHITYNEWTPLILGRTVMKAFNLLPKTYGFVRNYNRNINSGIINAFATAAYRFHTLIQGIFQLMNNNGNITENLQLRDLFNNPTSIYRKGAYDEYLNGFTYEPTQKFDKHFTQEITNHLFQVYGTGFGMDLIALNVQRGREHGLPGYNQYRKACGLNPIQSFEELESVMQNGSAETFKKLYKHVDDIDLFVAGNHENALPDAVVGPTFACILAEQSRRGKLGDRFWHENGKLPHSFTENQLYEIRKSSLARLICDNAYEIKEMQPLAFLQPIGRNSRVPCDDIGKVNLDFWIGERIFN